MKNIKINFLTFYFLFLLFLCGYLKIGLIIFFIVLFHELGHILFIKYFKFEIVSVNIYPFGGVTKINKDINTPIAKELIIASSGIIFQLIIFIIINLLPITQYTKFLFYKYNISIMIFNLLPIIPLDGSIILNSILNKIFSYKQSYYIYLLVSLIFLILYILSNYWFSLNNYLLVGLFLVKTYYAWKNYKYLYNKFLLERYLNKYEFKYISTKEGTLDILKLDTYQYFKHNNKIISEKEKLKERFNKAI